MSQVAQLTVDIEQVHVLSVTGALDGPGLRVLQRELDLLLDGGHRFLALDLSQVSSSDHRLFDALTRTSHLVEHRGGWLRLLGLGCTVIDTLDDATLPEILLVYRASDWAPHGVR